MSSINTVNVGGENYDIEKTTSYEELNQQPKINDVTLSGNKSASDLYLVGGVKGSAETEYRFGNVNISLPNMGVTYGTANMTAGSTELANGHIYFQYEAE